MSIYELKTTNYVMSAFFVLIGFSLFGIFFDIGNGESLSAIILAASSIFIVQYLLYEVIYQKTYNAIQGSEDVPFEKIIDWIKASERTEDEKKARIRMIHQKFSPASEVNKIDNRYKFSMLIEDVKTLDFWKQLALSPFYELLVIIKEAGEKGFTSRVLITSGYYFIFGLVIGYNIGAFITDPTFTQFFVILICLSYLAIVNYFIRGIIMTNNAILDIINASNDINVATMVLLVEKEA